MKNPQFFRTKKKKTTSEIITMVVYSIFFFIAAIIFLFPIYNAILSSITLDDNFERESVKSIFEYFTVNGKPQFHSWVDIIDSFKVSAGNKGSAYIEDMLFNSVWFTIAKTGLSLMSSTILAYAVAKFEFPGKKLIYLTAIFVQTIPIFGSGTTAYKLFDSLNMVNNPLLFWIAWCTGFDFTFIIMHGVFSGISNTYSEAAKIDGASNLRILVNIVLPMALPTIIALFVTNSLTVWNDYSTIMIYLKDYPTLGYGLYAFTHSGGNGKYVENANAIKNCAILFSILPIALIYSLSQKLILTNISVGGLKG